MNTVWNMASCVWGAPGKADSKIEPKVTPPVNSLTSHPMTMNMTTPLQLNIRWIMAVLFAFLPLVIPAMSATTQDPMLEPMVRKMP